MKNFKSITIVLGIMAVCGIWSSCKNDTTKNSETTPPPATTAAAPTSTFTVSTFSEFPPEIDGCSCYFSQSNADFDGQKYVYVDDYEKKAFVSINGKMEKLTSNGNDKTNGKNVVKTFTNADYEVVVNINQVKGMDEVTSYVGTLTIKSKNGQTQTINIQGECGC